MNEKLKAIIFDFDYTLGDSTEAIVISLNYALETMGYSLKSTEEISRTVGMKFSDICLELAGDDSAEIVDKLADYFVDKITKIVAEYSELYDGVKDILNSLKQKNYKTAIVTTKRCDQVYQILEKYDAMHLFDVIVGSDTVKAEKPDPKGMLFALDKLGVQKEEILYVGDSVVDAQTAENAGVKFAAVLTGTTSKEEHEKYDNVYIAENLKDIYRYIMEYEVYDL